MIAGRTGAAVVLGPRPAGPAIVTERDLLRCVGDTAADLDSETVGAHLTADVVYADADWPLERGPPSR